jgi:hypothetical protein
MNQNQRKYAAQRITTICENRKKALIDSFNSNPINKLRLIPNPEFPNFTEVTKAILNEPSTAVFKSPDEIRALNFGPYTYVSQLFQPVNADEIEACKSYNQVINERKAIEVDARISEINRQAREAIDTIILGANEEAIRAISNFETLINGQ